VATSLRFPLGEGAPVDTQDAEECLHLLIPASCAAGLFSAHRFLVAAMIALLPAAESFRLGFEDFGGAVDVASACFHGRILLRRTGGLLQTHSLLRPRTAAFAS
jgi:hypothetical protein